MAETFNFTVEWIVFKSPDSTFAVVVGRDSEGNPQTLCGPLCQVVDGERLVVTATASNHPRFGPRWEVDSVHIREPDDRPSRVTFLRSIEGIGEARAEALYDMFGEATFDRIDDDPKGTFMLLPKVGDTTASKAAASWKERRHVREVMRLLGEAGLRDGQGIASRAVSEWGADTADKLNDDPYCLIELTGVGFVDADRFARYLETPDTASRRIQAGALHLLREAHGSKGHTWVQGVIATP